MSKNKVDACIFCGTTPCSCNVAKKSLPRKARPPAPKTNDAPIKRSSHFDAMKAAAAAKPEPTRSPDKHTPQMQLSEDDIILNAAIRNLGPLLAESERERYAGILTSKPHPDEAKIMWKARHRQDD